MSARDRHLGDAVSRERAAAAKAARAEFNAFLGRYGLDESREAVALYLTLLASEPNGTGSRVRRRLQLLDLDRRMRGETPWLSDSQVRTLLRGMHSTAPIGRGGGYEPLYLELVQALVDVASLLTLDQHRGVAAALLVDATDLPAAVLARMTWDDVRLTRKGATLTVTRTVGRGEPRAAVHRFRASPGDSTCVVTALRRLRSESTGRYVFGSRGSRTDQDRVRSLTQPIVAARAGGSGPLPRTVLLDVLGSISNSSPTQVRDRAVLILGYIAALRTREATGLRQGDIEVIDRGLAITIPGRRQVTYVPRGDAEYDPVALWQSWVERMALQGKEGADRPAFPSCNYSAITDVPLAEMGLNCVVHQRCEQAELSGHYTWTSLRAGMMRTAIRNDVRDYAVAAHADLTSLTSVQRHEHRENLLRKNVAGRLGL